MNEYQEMDQWSPAEHRAAAVALGCEAMAQLRVLLNTEEISDRLRAYELPIKWTVERAAHHARCSLDLGAIGEMTRRGAAASSSGS